MKTVSLTGVTKRASQSIIFFVLFSTTFLASCFNEEASKIDSRLLVGNWSGETDKLSWCIEMTEDLRYRRTEFDKFSSVMRFETGSYEFQRGKRILFAGKSSSEDEYRGWQVSDNVLTLRNLYVVTSISGNKQAARALYIHNSWAASGESVSQRVESCDPSIEQFRANSRTVPR